MQPASKQHRDTPRAQCPCPIEAPIKMLVMLNLLVEPWKQKNSPSNNTKPQLLEHAYFATTHRWLDCSAACAS